MMSLFVSEPRGNPLFVQFTLRHFSLCLVFHHGLLRALGGRGHVDVLHHLPLDLGLGFGGGERHALVGSTPGGLYGGGELRVPLSAPRIAGGLGRDVGAVGGVLTSAAGDGVVHPLVGLPGIVRADQVQDEQEDAVETDEDGKDVLAGLVNSDLRGTGADEAKNPSDPEEDGEDGRDGVVVAHVRLDVVDLLLAGEETDEGEEVEAPVHHVGQDERHHKTKIERPVGGNAAAMKQERVEDEWC